MENKVSALLGQNACGYENLSHRHLLFLIQILSPQIVFVEIGFHVIQINLLEPEFFFLF